MLPDRALFPLVLVFIHIPHRVRLQARTPPSMFEMR